MLFFWIAAPIVMIFGFVVFWGAPYVPSKKKEIEQAFTELYPLSDRDVLVDIGSGDGIVLRAAAKKGARAVGYELNPLLVGIARMVSRGDRLVSVKLANFWRVPLPDDTTVVYSFGESRDIQRMAEKVACEADRLQRQLTFISYAFEVPGQKPQKTSGAYFLYVYKPLQTKKA